MGTPGTRSQERVESGRGVVVHGPKVERRRRWPMAVGGVVLGVPAALFALSVALTPPLEPVRPEESLPLPAADVAKVEAAEAKAAAVSWPEGRLDGHRAKQVLLDITRAVLARLEAQPGYTAMFKKQELIGGKLQPEQTIELKVRHEPFAVYMKFLEPDAGKEVVYHEGRYDNEIMAHGGKLTRLLLPRLKVSPTSALAMKGNRHPVTEAGLLNMTRKLVQFRELDLNDEEAGTILDRVTLDDGREYLRSIHTHPHDTGERPFAYVEVFYDPETWLPVRFDGYEWPESGNWTGEKVLGERYIYEAVNLKAELTDLDFDPANPAYEFKRF